MSLFDWIAIGVAVAIIYYAFYCAGYAAGVRAGRTETEKHWTQDKKYADSIDGKTHRFLRPRKAGKSEKPT